MNTPIDPALLSDLAALTPSEQASVATLVRDLRAAQGRDQGTKSSGQSDAGPAPLRSLEPTLSREERTRRMRALAGSLSADEAQKMMADIEEGCGQINHAAW
jgi:hypothetical protein